MHIVLTQKQMRSMGNSHTSSAIRLFLFATVYCKAFPSSIKRSVSSTAATTSMKMTKQPVYNAYPLHQLDELQQKFSNVKVVHIIRHAEGFHNVNNQYKHAALLDARLTEKGLAQCQEKATEGSPPADLVITSTMTRCIQTALHSFPSLVDKPEIPFLAHESIRETVNYECDRRRPISEIRQEFPRVDFSHVQEEEDEIWNGYEVRIGQWEKHRESSELHKVAERGRAFWTWLSKRDEEEVIVCTHSAFLRCILSWGQEGGVEFAMSQLLDDREDPGPDVPLKRYRGDEKFEQYVRRDFANCEMRSFVLVFDEH